MKIYTKTGDTGETGLLGGKRVSKGSLEIQIIGEVDELNAALGIVLMSLRGAVATRQSHLSSPPVLWDCFVTLAMTIQNIQRDLFKVGAELAAIQTSMIERLEKVGTSRVEEMEKMVDEFWGELPELKNFILPGGSAAGAHLHLARVICRRVERELVAYGQTTPLRPELYIYLNRLSDFLFASARWVNFQAGEGEIKV